VRQLIAQYQARDSPSSLSPRPILTSRPTQTLPPRRGRLGSAGEGQDSVAEPQIGLPTGAIYDVYNGSDNPGTENPAETSPSPSDPDIFDSSDSEEDISSSFRPPRDRYSTPTDPNIRKVSLKLCAVWQKPNFE
jgi:hypothetical protein